MLTEKQKAFCKEIVAGKTNKDAYMSAYNCTSDNAAYNESTKLLMREDIQAEINVLRRPIEQNFRIQAVNARQQQIEFILERIEVCKRKNDETSIIRYTDMLNKIYGTYRDKDGIEDTTSPINEIDTEQLISLIQAG